MISAICWVPKGVAKAIPEAAEPPSKEEIEELLKSGALERGGNSEDEEDEDMDIDAAKCADEVALALAVADAIGKNSGDKSSTSKFEDMADILGELDMDHYDDEDEGIDIFGKALLGGTYYPSNDMDPYLKDKDDDDEEDIEDTMIKPTDGVIVCVRNEDDVSHLEVWIFEDKTEDGDPNMYVHHDIILPAFPLCTTWLDCNLKGGDRGNFIAVGSMEPDIEIWDLDLLDEVQPFTVLGGTVKEKLSDKTLKSKKKKGKTPVTYKEGSHTDSVLGLAWNKEFRNVLASASADQSVKIWDVAAGKCELTMRHHSEKVQAVAWNRHEPTVLLSGSFDHSIVMMDMRAPSHAGIRWSVSADVESLTWDPHTAHSFVVSVEDGTVQGFDIRAAAADSNSGSKPSFTLHAHDKAVCTVSYNPAAANLLATGSTDKMVKLWDISNNQPACVASKNPKAAKILPLLPSGYFQLVAKADPIRYLLLQPGHIFSISFSEDNPFFLAIGGSKGKLEIWDTLSEAEVARRFGNFSHGKVESASA